VYVHSECITVKDPLAIIELIGGPNMPDLFVEFTFKNSHLQQLYKLLKEHAPGQWGRFFARNTTIRANTNAATCSALERALDHDDRSQDSTLSSRGRGRRRPRDPGTVCGRSGAALRVNRITTNRARIARGGGLQYVML